MRCNPPSAIITVSRYLRYLLSFMERRKIDLQIDPEKFALAVVSSSSPQLNAISKARIYKEAYAEAKKLSDTEKQKAKKDWKI